VDGVDWRQARVDARTQGAIDWLQQGAIVLGSQLKAAASNLSQADLRGWNLAQAQLQEAYLDRADLRGTDLSQAQLQGASFQGALMDGATCWPQDFDPIGAGLWLIAPQSNLATADLSHFDLSEVDLSRANLRRANLIRTDLSRAALMDADLSRADLTQAILFASNLTRAVLHDAQLEQADFRRATLPNGERWNGQGTVALYGVPRPWHSVPERSPPVLR
jgi:uncharacterized protein YjbI with pentapeptide repeats